MRRLGDLHSIAAYRRTTTFRIHEPTVLPGILQTEAYIRRMLAFWYAFLDAPDDTEATVAMKAERSAIALSPAKRIAVVLGEQALHTRRGTPDEHAEQLTHLLTLMRLPFVSVGVIPADAQRYALASIGFWIFDDNAVALETPTAAVHGGGRGGCRRPDRADHESRHHDRGSEQDSSPPARLVSRTPFSEVGHVSPPRM